MFNEIKKLGEGRINRKDFIIGSIIFGIFNYIVAIPTYVVFFIQHPITKNPAFNETAFKLQLLKTFSPETPEGILFIVLSLIVTTWSMTLVIRRFHDIGKHGKWAVLLLIQSIVSKIIAYYILVSIEANSINPLANVSITLIGDIFTFAISIMALYLLITKGENKSNVYGDIPSDKFSVRKTLLNQ